MIGTRRGIRQPLTFAAIGIVSTLAYAAIYAVLRDSASAQLANSIALAVTAIANTQANRRLTFGIRGTGGLVADHVAGLAALGVALAISSVSIALLHLTAREPGVALELAALGCANVVATISRFVLLHLWLERHERLTVIRKGAGG